MEDCLFCRIVRGELPAARVLESDRILAFADINPATRGHTLVIPKQHCLSILDISEEDAGLVMEAARRIARAMPGAIGAKGVNLLHCAGDEAWQDVFHFHMHVIPRYQRSELRSAWVMKPGDPEDIADAARRIAGALD